MWGFVLKSSPSFGTIPFRHELECREPAVELDRRVVGEIEGAQLFWMADVATAAIDARVEAGDLAEEAVDDHDVRKHYPNGPDLVDDVAGSKRCLPEAFVHVAQAIEEALVLRERCRLRRLRVS